MADHAQADRKPADRISIAATTPTAITGALLNGGTAVSQLAAIERVLNGRLARSPNAGATMATIPQGGAPVVQRAITAGGQTRELFHWRQILDPDNDDEARRRALGEALHHFDGRTFDTTNALVSAIAGEVAKREPGHRAAIEAEAMRARESDIAARARGAPILPHAPAPASEQDQKGEEPDGGADTKPFGTLDAALIYLSDNTGFEVAQIRELFESFEPDQLRFLAADGISPADIVIADWQKELEGLERKNDKMPMIGSGKKAKGDWATSAVRGSAKGLVDDAADPELFPGGKYTVHHKISRSRLRGLHMKMKGAGAAAAPLSRALAVTARQSGAGNELNALLNIPGNLEVGPQERAGDPGSGFDPNYESGAMTPRSAILNEVDSDIQREPIDYAAVAAKLLEVQRLHEAGLPRGGKSVLTAPKKGQWKKGARNKFTRS